MAKSVTQKRRREAEADQERRHEGDANGGDDTQSTAASTTTTATTAAPPAKKARVEERRSVFVRSLPASATSEKLTEFFSEHFPVKHATVVTDPKTKASRGYGFVTFTDAEDAVAAKAKLDNEVFDGRRLRLDIAEPRHRQLSGKSKEEGAAAVEKKKKREEDLAEVRRAPKLIVRNLPWSIKKSEDLAALFRMYGKVKFADLPQSKGKLAGFGFVTLRGRPNAERAIAGVNGKSVDGRTLAVDWAVDKQTWDGLQKEENTQEAKGGAKDAGDKASKKSKKSKKEEGQTAASKPKTADELQAEEDLRNFMENNLANLEEEDNESSSDSDSGSDSDGDSESDGESDGESAEEKDWEDEDEDEEADEGAEQPPQKTLSTNNTMTLFVRNLPFTTTDEELKAHFSQFGLVRYARIVMDRATDRPAGTGFVCFVHEEDAKACLRTAPNLLQKLQQQQAAKFKTAGLAANKHSVLQDERVDRDGRYTLAGRVLQVAQAVSKDEATRLTTEGGGSLAAAQRAREKDKRRLFLLSEGTIAANTPLYALLPPSEVQMREASAKQRQKMVKANPSLHLSLTRLAVRNIPRHLDSKALKELARRAVVGFATDVKEGLRQPLAKEELARGGQRDREAEQLRRAKGKGVVRQAKIVFETDKGSKVDEAAGGGKSRGYGFIEYWSHRWALSALRWLNGHPVKSEDGKKTHRLIVEFAIENANVVARRKANEEKSRLPRPPRQEDGGKGDEEAKGGRSGKDGKAAGKSKDKGKGKGKSRGKDGTDAKGGKSGKDGGDSGAALPNRKEKAGAKLALRQQIIQRKRMMRKKKGVSRAGK